jgi:integrase
MSKSLANKLLTPQFRAELARLIGPHNRKAHDRKGGVKRDCASVTRDDREAILLLAFAELAMLGYKLKSPTGIREKHLHALAAHWEQKGLSAQTIHKRFSTLRVFDGWIGKQGLVGDLDEYFGDSQAIKRTSISILNKEWEANGVKVAALIEQATALDERFGLYLSLQHQFGLRVKEAINLRPFHNNFDETALQVSEGSKGGRPRLVPIETAEQREVVEWAKRVAAKSRSGRIRWPDRSWLQAQNRFYGLMKRIGATKADLGITAHGLRHGDAQRQYRKVTGHPTPVEGGALGRIDWGTHKMGVIKVSVRLGHNRSDVLGYYGGSYGHALRTTIPSSSFATVGAGGQS